MTKTQFDRKIAELIRTNTESLRKEVKRLRDCGGLDLASFSDDYRAPKIALTVALERMADQWLPLDKEGRKEAANLRCF